VHALGNGNRLVYWHTTPLSARSATRYASNLPTSEEILALTDRRCIVVRTVSPTRKFENWAMSRLNKARNRTACWGAAGRASRAYDQPDVFRPARSGQHMRLWRRLAFCVGRDPLAQAWKCRSRCVALLIHAPKPCKLPKAPRFATTYPLSQAWNGFDGDGSFNLRAARTTGV